jgi:hypothetical protein
LVRHFCEGRDPANASQPLHAAIDNRESRRIVAAVLELAQTLEQDGNDVAPRYGSYDSAHNFSDW